MTYHNIIQLSYKIILSPCRSGPLLHRERPAPDDPGCQSAAAVAPVPATGANGRGPSLEMACPLFFQRGPM